MGHCLWTGIVDDEQGRRRSPQRLHGARDVHRLRDAHPGLVDGRLQPDELPQRLGLAARQRPDRGRACGATASSRRRSGSSAPCSTRRRLRRTPARAVLRVRPRRAHPARALSDLVLAAGVGRRYAAPAARTAAAVSSPTCQTGSLRSTPRCPTACCRSRSTSCAWATRPVELAVTADSLASSPGGSRPVSDRVAQSNRPRAGSVPAPTVRPRRRVTRMVAHVENRVIARARRLAIASVARRHGRAALLHDAPQGYGGVECVVAGLVDGLVARGHRRHPAWPRCTRATPCAALHPHVGRAPGGPARRGAAGGRARRPGRGPHSGADRTTSSTTTPWPGPCWPAAAGRRPS